MGLKSAGSYLEELRKMREMGRPEVAHALELSVDTLTDAERGRTRMNGPALMRLIGLLGGSYDEVARLLADAQDNVAQARNLARAWALRPAVLEDRPLTAEEEATELWDIALGRAGGDVDEARRLLLRALDESLGK